MNTLGDFLNSLCEKCGLQGDKALVDLLSNSTIATTPMPDSLANSLNTNLMSLEGAKNNPAVLNHFKPIILKAVDDKLAIMGEKFGLGDDFAIERNTYKKTELLESKIESKIKELEAKQAKTTDPDKEAKYTSQIQELTTKLATLTDQKTQEIEALKAEYGTKFTDMVVNQSLTTKKYANKDLAPELNVTIAKTVLQQQLAAKGAILVNENGVLKLKQSANPTMDYVDAGFKPVSYSDFVDATLAENKLLEVTGAQTQNPPPPAQIPSGQQTNTSKFDAAIAQAEIKTN